jgi:opacity protein-like surface antigen
MVGGRSLTAVVVAAIAASGAWTDSSRAQNPKPRAPTDQRTPSTATRGGYPLGSFLFFPELTIGEIYDDNIYATQQNTQSDYITRIAPSFSLVSNWRRHALNFWGGSSLDFYARKSSENTQDAWLGFNGRYDIDDTSNLFGGVTLSRSHEDRASPDDVAGLKPTVYYQVSGHVGVLKRIGAWTARVGTTVKYLNFNNVPGVFGTINNNDRDRTEISIGGRLSYALSPNYSVFVQGAADVRRYVTWPDDNGFDRNSTGFNSGVGLAFQFGRVLWGEAHVGYLMQFYRGLGLSTVEGMDFGGRVNWRIMNGLMFTAFADRSVEETTLFGATANLYTAFGGRLSYNVTSRLNLSTGLTLARSRYVDINRTDQTAIASAAARYQLTPWLFASAEYQFRRRESDVPGQSYIENWAMLRVGTDFGATRKVPIAPLGARDAGPMFRAAHRSIFAGAYLGALVSKVDLLTNVDGVRGPNRAYDVDFGQLGVAPGGFFGYGLVFDRVYVGLEVSGQASTAEWDHSRLPGGRVFSLDELYNVSGTLRIGYVHSDLAMFYGLIGLVHAGYNAVYMHGNRTTDLDQELTGLRIGAGVEVPLTASLFARLEYAYNRFDSFVVPYNNGADTFSPSTGVVTVGLGWRFNNRAQPVPAGRTSKTFRGPYGGLQLGFGSLMSDTSGARDAGSVLRAEFAGTGFTGGLFGGYGYTLGDFYLGVEGEFDGSSARWRHFRGAPSRNYAVRKLLSYGGSLRAGYIFRKAALIYARAGVVNTMFKTRYTQGSTTTEPENTKLGVRIGGGIEVPVSRRFFLRFDYTHTQYGRYFVAYNDQVDRFQNSENLFRVGVLFRY